MTFAETRDTSRAPSASCYVSCSELHLFYAFFMQDRLFSGSTRHPWTWLLFHFIYLFAVKIAVFFPGSDFMLLFSSSSLLIGMLFLLCLPIIITVINDYCLFLALQK